jgi:hypothetical protein
MSPELEKQSWLPVSGVVLVALLEKYANVYPLAAALTARAELLLPPMPTLKGVACELVVCVLPVVAQDESWLNVV